MSTPTPLDIRSASLRGDQGCCPLGRNRPRRGGGRKGACGVAPRWLRHPCPRQHEGEGGEVATTPASAVCGLYADADQGPVAPPQVRAGLAAHCKSAPHRPPRANSVGACRGRRRETTALPRSTTSCFADVKSTRRRGEPSSRCSDERGTTS